MILYESDRKWVDTDVLMYVENRRTKRTQETKSQISRSSSIDPYVSPLAAVSLLQTPHHPIADFHFGRQ